MYTLHRTIESLYEELVTEGIIVRHPKTSLSDYEGEYSYLGTTLRQASIEPMPSISDVRRLVAEFAILPLGKRAVRSVRCLMAATGTFSSPYMALCVFGWNVCLMGYNAV